MMKRMKDDQQGMKCGCGRKRGRGRRKNGRKITEEKLKMEGRVKTGGRKMIGERMAEDAGSVGMGYRSKWLQTYNFLKRIPCYKSATKNERAEKKI